MKKPITKRDRLIGAFGGGGGALLLMMLFFYMLNPSWWASAWLMNLVFVVMGTLLVLSAVYLRLKK